MGLLNLFGITETEGGKLEAFRDAMAQYQAMEGNAALLENRNRQKRLARQQRSVDRIKNLLGEESAGEVESKAAAAEQSIAQAQRAIDGALPEIAAQDPNLMQYAIEDAEARDVAKATAAEQKASPLGFSNDEWEIINELPVSNQLAVVEGALQNAFAQRVKEANANKWSVLSEEEVAKAGLSLGTVAQIGSDGKMNILSKPKEFTPYNVTNGDINLVISNAKEAEEFWSDLENKQRFSLGRTDPLSESDKLREAYSVAIATPAAKRTIYQQNLIADYERRYGADRLIAQNLGGNPAELEGAGTQGDPYVLVNQSDIDKVQPGEYYLWNGQVAQK